MYGTSEGRLVLVAGLAGAMAAYLQGRKDGRFLSNKQLAGRGIAAGAGAALAVHVVRAQKAMEPPAPSSVPSAESLEPYIANGAGPSIEDMKIYNHIVKLRAVVALLSEKCHQHGNNAKACRQIIAVNDQIRMLQSQSGLQVLAQGAALDLDAGTWDHG